MKSFVFRIRRQYFNAIVNGNKPIEYRRDSLFWQQRLKNLEKVPNRDAWMPADLTAVFICGKRVCRKRIIYIERIPTPTDFSEQGKKDVDTPTCIAFHLEKKEVRRWRVTKCFMDKSQEVREEKATQLIQALAEDGFKVKIWAPLPQHKTSGHTHVAALCTLDEKLAIGGVRRVVCGRSMVVTRIISTRRLENILEGLRQVRGYAFVDRSIDGRVSLDQSDGRAEK